MVYPKINRTWEWFEIIHRVAWLFGERCAHSRSDSGDGCIKHWPTTEIISLSSHKFVIWLANCRRNNYIPIAYTYSSNIKFRWAFWKWCIAAYQSICQGVPYFHLLCNQQAQLQSTQNAGCATWQLAQSLTWHSGGPSWGAVWSYWDFPNRWMKCRWRPIDYLVVLTCFNPSEKWWSSSVGMMKFPFFLGTQKMFQTTTQN